MKECYSFRKPKILHTIGDKHDIVLSWNCLNGRYNYQEKIMVREIRNTSIFERGWHLSNFSKWE